MYYSENVNQSIYCPDVIQNPVNQSSYYLNSTQNRFKDLERKYDSLKNKLDIHNENLNKKILDLDTNYTNVADLQKNIAGDLSQHKKAQDMLKKRLANRQRQIEKVLTQELQSVVKSQEGVNQAIFKQLDEQEKLVDEKLRPVKNQQKSMKRKIQNSLEQQRAAVSEQLQLIIEQQEIVNSHVEEKLNVHELKNSRFEKELDEQALVNRQVLKELEEQESINRKVVRELDEHDTVILQELQPFIAIIQENLANPIANLVKSLSPGTIIGKITIQGSEIVAKSFLDYNYFTNTSTFLVEENKILSINTNRIDSLTFG